MVVVLGGQGCPPFYCAVAIRYDGNLIQGAMAMWFGVGNRSTRRWENSGNLHKIGRWQIGWKYDGSETRNTE